MYVWSIYFLVLHTIRWNLKNNMNFSNGTLHFVYRFGNKLWALVQSLRISIIVEEHSNQCKTCQISVYLVRWLKRISMIFKKVLQGRRVVIYWSDCLDFFVIRNFVKGNLFLRLAASFWSRSC